MDIRMPGMDGIEATRRITEDPALRGAHVLILTTFEHDDYIFGALRAGAAGFLLEGHRPRTNCWTRSGWSRRARACWAVA